MIVSDEIIECDYDSHFVWYTSDEIRVPISRNSPVGYKVNGRHNPRDMAPANCDDTLLKELFYYQYHYFVGHGRAARRFSASDNDIIWEVNALRVIRDEMLRRCINPRTTSGKARYAIKGLTI